jgi:bis(5'-nucleosyl)-tetraphosphatase (symmetrical)
MSHYAIGDIQGCYDELQRLLERLRFDPAQDRLWLVGDLVNRGPGSLETLRLVRGLGEAAVCVLGNHDLHLLAVARGLKRHKRRDTLEPILHATDADELLDWLRHRPLFHHDAGLGYTLVHAGLAPQWDLAQAQACAREVEAALRGPDWLELLANMYGDEPDCWSDDLRGWSRLRVIINAFTRLRYCTAEGQMDFADKGRPGTQEAGLTPWFALPWRRSAGLRIVFGHWSTLGLLQGQGVIALDTGCVWGGRLTAARLDTHPVELTALDCAGAQRPGAAP